MVGKNNKKPYGEQDTGHVFATRRWAAANDMRLCAALACSKGKPLTGPSIGGALEGFARMPPGSATCLSMAREPTARVAQ